MRYGSMLVRWVHIRWLVTALGCTLVAALLITLRQAGYLEFFELATYDAFIRLQSTQDTDAPIVIIGVSEEDIQTLRQWPLTDANLAEVLRSLVGYAPRVIGLDIYRDLPVPPGTERLERVLRENEEIILVEKAPGADRIGIPPPEILKHSTRVGFNDVVPDAAGVVRRALLFMDYGASTSYSFGLRLALRYLETEGVFPEPGTPDPAYLKLGPTTLIPLEPEHGGYTSVDAGGYQVLLGFAGGSQPFHQYSLGELRSGRIKKTALQDKIILVGVISESVKDTFYTPYDTQWDRTGIPGIALHAHLVNQLLLAGQQGMAPRRSWSNLFEAFWISCWCLLGGLLSVRVRSTSAFVGLTAAGLFVLVGTAYAAFAAGWWIPLVPPAGGWIGCSALTSAYLYSDERWERGLLMQLFRKNVSREVAEMIWKQRERILDGGNIRSHTLTATVLFSDIHGFTHISEQLDPQVLMRWLNQYVASMTRLVMRHKGVVDDYAGDGIKANFGVPFARETESESRQDAVNAVRCALAMQNELQNLNEIWQKNALPAISMRVGINTGIVVAGSLGSAERVKYTTVGDAVNVAARLEGLNIDVQKVDVSPDSLCRILISEETLRYVGKAFQASYLGRFSVKGRAQPVNTYLVLHERIDNNTNEREDEPPCASPGSHEELPPV